MKETKVEKELRVRVDVLIAEKGALMRQIQQQHEEIEQLKKDKLHHSTQHALLAVELKVKDSILEKMIGRL